MGQAEAAAFAKGTLGFGAHGDTPIAAAPGRAGRPPNLEP